MRVDARRLAWAAALLWPALAPAAPQMPQEIHQRLVPSSPQDRRVALTLDACSGAFDADLIDFLVRNRIPATLFVTRRWLQANPVGVQTLKANLDLFDIENHGANHVPAVIGAGRKVYGIPGEPDILHLRQEVKGGADAITQYFGVAPHWYRGATAEYDEQAADEIRRMGYQIAGFSVNADAGASLPRTVIEQRVRAVKPGDVIIAHMNKPRGDTAEALRPSLLELLRKGFQFVRLDQVGVQPVR